MRSRHGALPYREFVYDHDPSEVELLGWDEFIARQWESIFIGYRSWVGLAVACCVSMTCYRKGGAGAALLWHAGFAGRHLLP
jgi:hypothetical protein